MPNNLYSTSSHTLPWRQPREALSRLYCNNPAQKQLFPPPLFPPFSCTHHNTGKVGRQRVSLPQWLHPCSYTSLPQVWRRKLMFSLLSSPCVQLSSPVAYVDHLPCCSHTHACTNTHPSQLLSHQTSRVMVSFAPRGRAPSLPLPDCSSSSTAAFHSPCPPLLCP